MQNTEITSEFVKTCLHTTTDYKNARAIKDAVTKGQEHSYPIICEVIHEILSSKGYPPMSKLLALRVMFQRYPQLSKELIDLFIMKFVDYFEKDVLFTLREYTIYQCPSTDANRGATFFGENLDKDVRQIGVSLVRLSLDCVKAWAMFFPKTQLGGERKYYLFYEDLIKQGVNFPPWAYYKQEFVEAHTSPSYREVDLLKTQVIKPDLIVSNPNPPPPVDQPIKQVVQPQKHQEPEQIHQTPGGNPTPLDPKEQIIQNAKKVLVLCAQLKEQTVDTCASTLEYQKGIFNNILDEAMAKHQEMDQLVNDLIDVEEEDMAAEIMLEMDNLKTLQDDILQVTAQQNYWPQFRKKYMGNKQDIAGIKENQRLFEQQQHAEQQKKIEEEKRKEIERQQQLEREKQQREHEDEKQRKEREIQEKEKFEKEKQDRQKQEKERQEKLDREKQEHERMEKERQDHERRERERLEREQQERNRLQHEQLQKQQQQDRERQEAIRLEQERVEKLKHEQEQKQREQQDQDRARFSSEIQKHEYNNQLVSEPQLIVRDLGFQTSNLQQPSQDQIKVNQLIGNNQISSSQIQPPNDSRLLQNSRMGYSQIQNRLVKPVSSTSQGKRQQPALNLRGDISGAPEVIVDPQKKSSDGFYSSQISILTKQLEALEKDKLKLQQQLNEEEEKVAQLRLRLVEQSSGRVPDSIQELQRLQEETEKQKRDIHNFQTEKRGLEQQIKQLQQTINEQRANTDMIRQQLKDSHESDIKAEKKQSQQLFQEKQALLQQLEMQKQHSGVNPELQNKIFTAEQQIFQLQREIDEQKKQKDQLARNHSNDIDLLKHKISEQQNFIDTLQSQINLYKQQVDKGIKDYSLLQEKQKESQESSLQQIIEARKEGLTKQSQLSQVQLQLSDKEEEYKQLNLNYNAVVNEKKQLQKNLEQTQSQMNQFIQLYQNGDSRNTSLLQSKLSQTLDEMDKLRETQKANLKEKDEQYQQRINQLIEEKQTLEKDIKILQYEAQQAALNALKMQTQIKTPLSQPKPDNKSAFSEQISVNVNVKGMEVNSPIPEQNIIIQPACPLPVFKHFPSTCLFNLPKKIEKGRIVTAECLELIFPYQDPSDYFQNRQKKNRKGRIIQSTSVSHEISHFDDQNRNLFKQRCLGAQGLLFINNDFQFGLSFQIQHYQGNPYNTYGLYIYNINQRQDGFCLQFLDGEQFSQFWASPIELRKPLYEASQELVEILVSCPKTPYQLLTVQIGHNDTHPYQFYIPNHICQSITYKEVRLNEFRNKWAANIQNQIRTELLLLNKAVFGTVASFQQMIPRLLILNSHKMNDYEMGIDEIKLVGVGFYFDLQFYIKFEILPDEKICIYITYDSKQSSKRQILDQILQGYAFILGNGKSQ